uniref:Phosphatase and actin regulator n=1 Tax=Periophthalmus magnuspinnatus TaxID=409849 RepID=A0A3B3ZKU1_9GOBI
VPPWRLEREQIRSLERARTGTFLKHKLCSRPERSELVRMHILQETQADSSLQAAQLRLKKARLADSLNEKISQRPGPMELVEKNILPVQSEDKEAGNGTYWSHIISGVSNSISTRATSAKWFVSNLQRYKIYVCVTA